MPPRNGEDTEAANTLRLINLVARLNDALRDFSVELRLFSDRLERLESAVEKSHEVIVDVRHHVGEARDDLERVREETNPRIRVPAAFRDKEEDKGFEITDEQVRLPRPWVGVLLKAGMSAGGGAALLRVVQWLTTGH